MLKRICLLSLAGLLIFSFATAMTIGLAQEAKADSVFTRVGLEDIQGLDSLKASLGATQNSLTLELAGSAGTYEFSFRSSGEWTNLRSGSDFDAVNNRHGFRYVADARPSQAYALSPAGEENTYRIRRTDYCGYRPEVLIHGGLNHYDDENGYNQSWREADFNDRGKLSARIYLPLTADMGEVTDEDYCMLLEAEVDLQITGSPAMFALAGGRLDEDSCSGLQLYGRGGDDLRLGNVTWFCDQDMDTENLRRTEVDALTTVESPPFGNYFIFLEARPDSDDCGGRILVNKDNFDANESALEAQWQDWHNNCSDGQFDKDKAQKRAGSVSVLNTLRRTDAEDGAQAPGFTSADTGVSDSPFGTGLADESCEWRLSGVVLGYIACSVAEAVSGGLEWLEAAAKKNLKLDRGDYTQTFAGATGEFTYKDAWANIRNFMTFAIVGTALFMVISTALDIGWFSNYTVKKYLPRLIVGTILIQFSWALGDLFIQLTNQLGDFMESILYAAVPGARGHDLADIFGGGNFSSFFAGAVGIAAAIYAILLPIGFTAIVFLFIGWLFLVARKYMLIMLLILGPLGLALWVLPGSDRAWRFYSKTFFYLLLFYPIVVTTIAAGKIFSYLILL